jgi:hypothetical protein
LRIDSNGKIFMNEGVPFSWTDSSLNVSAEIYGDASDNLVFRNTSAKTERMRIDAAGNVGIGITNPATKLHVGGIVQVVENSNTAFYGGNFVRVFGDQNYAFRDTGGSYIANISMSGNSYFNGGNVGIGTASPSEKLEVLGTIKAGDVGGTNGDIYLQGKYSNGALVTIGSERSSGGVFLGYGVSPSTTTQGEFLSASSITMTHGAYVASNTHKWWTASSGSSVAVGSQVTTMTERMRISADGNVGIGTSSPARPLNVVNDAGSNPIQSIRNSSAAWSQYALTRYGTEGEDVRYMDFGYYRGSSEPTRGLVIKSQADATLVTFLDSGNVGIGTSTPSDKLHVKSSANQVATFETSQTSDMAIELKNSQGSMFFGLGGGEEFAIGTDADLNGTNSKFVVKNTGNVGIGIINPAQLLHVQAGSTGNGTIRVGGGAGLEISHNNSGATVQRIDSIYRTTSTDANLQLRTGILTFHTGSASTERMRLDASGGIAFGPGGNEPGNGNTNTGAGLRSLNNAASVMFSVSRNAGNSCRFNRNGVAGPNVNLSHDGSNAGSIDTSTSGTTYNTTSDRRLKDNIEPISDATDKLMDMNPVTHTWIANPEAPQVHGFIAQEMQEVVPEAVSGDAESDEMMSMDYGRITPVIVAALQDALNEIKELKTRIDELENK